jgi:hypothetical protein
VGALARAVVATIEVIPQAGSIRRFRPLAASPTNIATLLAILLLTVAGCDSSSRHAAQDTKHTAALRLTELRTPALRVPGYHTTGTFPQFKAAALNLGIVNAAIRTAVVQAEAQYARWARKELASFSKIGIRPLGGNYKTQTERRLISASSRLVSVLIPVTRRIGGGPESQDWLALTMDVRSGARISLERLFVNPSMAFRTAARYVRGALRSNNCFRSTSEYWRSGLGPAAANFRSFALTVRGIVFGFSSGQIAAAGCGGFAITVPFDIIKPYLSVIGRQSIAVSRSPRAA